jgi:hypothetical protein
LDLDNRTLDELLDPAQFATADEVEQFFIATPRPAMSLALANAQMEMDPERHSSRKPRSYLPNKKKKPLKKQKLTLLLAKTTKIWNQARKKRH